MKQAIVLAAMLAAAAPAYAQFGALTSLKDAPAVPPSALDMVRIAFVLSGVVYQQRDVMAATATPRAEP